MNNVFSTRACPRSKVEDAALRSGPKIDKYLGYHSISDSRPVGCGSSDWVNWDSRESLLEYISSSFKIPSDVKYLQMSQNVNRMQ